jgi:hypothetical protein
MSATSARRCCNLVPADADSGALAPAAPALDAPLSAAALALSLPALQAPALVGGHELPLAAARAAPVFLLSRSLRL